MFVSYVIIATCVVILVNLVPRINDMHGATFRDSPRNFIRFVGLCLTAVSTLWVSFSIILPGHNGQDYAIMLLLIGTAISWSTSPSIEKDWIDYLFKSGSTVSPREAHDVAKIK